VAETLEQEGHIDVLLCAAGAELPASLDELSIEDGKRMMDVNYWGVIRVFQAVYVFQRREDRGRNVTVRLDILTVYEKGGGGYLVM
jgi:NADP-dependent 3-hydroxy acid dehydrogenase YdfG